MCIASKTFLNETAVPFTKCIAVKNTTSIQFGATAAWFLIKCQQFYPMVLDHPCSCQHSEKGKKENGS